MCRIMTSVMAQHRNVIQSSIVGKETIHSGHFMISQFEADAQDDEYEVAVPVPEVSSKNLEIIPLHSAAVGDRPLINSSPKVMSLSIETSLSKLFQCMSIAYRQKLTSPKWNRFRGIRLRWKEKIRLNNVIWRCWHMQFVMKRNIGVCQFASPLDVHNHSKPEAVVLEGKYWKRKLSAVTAEYKRWRLFYQKLASSPAREQKPLNVMVSWNSNCINDDNTMMMDEDYMNIMSDTLFSTITLNQPFAFPDTREISRVASLADFIQPSLVQLQPNLDDYMDMLEPLQDLLSPTSKLPSVPEEYHPSDDLYRSLNVNYEDVSSSSFYQQSTTATNINTPSGIPSNENEHNKFYVKSEQDQPLQLSVSQEIGSKIGYRCNDLYHETNTTPLYANQNSQNSYSGYHAHSYDSHSTHSHSHDGSSVSYSTQQTNIKNLSAPVPINFNNSSVISNHNYPLYESNMSYSAPSSNMQSYSPSSSSNYKILSTSRSCRSNSLSMNPMDEELFAIPKLSQRGRSRSGSSLISNQSKFLQTDQCGSDSVTNSVLLTQLLTNNRQYCYPNNYQLINSNMSTHNCNSGYDTKTCYTVNGHRQVAHCTALLGRRSRTPDHILSSNSNPVGYCKPRTPILSSQNDGSLINLSNNPRHGSSEKIYNTVESLNNTSHGYSFNYSRRHSQNLLKSSQEKYHNSAVYPQNWSSISSCLSTNTGSINTVVPFVFNGGQSSHSEISTKVINSTSTSNSPKHPSSPSTSESLSLSPLTVSSPVRTTPSSPTTKSLCSSTTPYKEHRRVCHINAEQKRRCNIKNGFDTLHMLIPHLIQNSNTKLSKAAMLQKGAEYIRQLREERSQLRKEIESLKQQVDTLNSAISNCQSLLPATGAPVSRHKADKMREMFDEYVKERTKQNWKFWILSLICEPLLSSFNSSVSTTNIEELLRTTIQWADQYCSLVDLRPIVLNALRHVCTTTEILSNPNLLPEEVKTIVLNPPKITNKKN